MTNTFVTRLEILAAIGAAFVLLVGTSDATLIEGSVDLVANGAFAVVDTQNSTVDVTADSANLNFEG